MNPAGNAAPEFRHLKPLVLVGKVSLRGENRLTCFARECGKLIIAPDYAWFFRRRTRGGLGVVIYCERCKATAQFDPVLVYHYPDREKDSSTEEAPVPPPVPAAPPIRPQPPSPSRFIQAAQVRHRQGPPQKPRVGIWRPPPGGAST